MTSRVPTLGVLTVVAGLAQALVYWRLEKYRRDRMPRRTVSDHWNAFDALYGLVRPSEWQPAGRPLHVLWVVLVCVFVALLFGTVITTQP